MIAFHYPHSFYLLIPFAGLIGLYLWSRWHRRKELQKLGEWRLVQQLVPVDALIRRKKKDGIAITGLFLVIIAACGPQFGSKLKEVKQRGVDVFIAMDVSRSMLAEDVQPSRLERAKRSLGLLVKKLEGNRIGIIAFARQAVIQCPLTVDNEAAQMFLEILDENTIPVQGTAIGDAIRLAVKSFSQEDKSGRAIVLLTDGEDHRSDPVEAAKLAKEQGISIFTIGIGTTKGEVIKRRDAQGKVMEFHKFKGEMVVSHMDDALLTKIAMLTGGRYYRASSTDREIDEIADILNGFDKKEFSSKIYERLQERYQYFLFFGFLLLLIEFFFAEKKGQWLRIKDHLKKSPVLTRLSGRIAAGLIIAVLFPGLLTANIKQHIRKGNSLIEQGDLAGARGEFESAQIDAPEAAFIPYNIAATYYLEGKFDEALRNYDQAMQMAQDSDLKSKIAYNQGHVYFSKGQRDQAIERFKECLRHNPNDVDAKYNIEYIKAGKNPKQPFKPQPSDKNSENREKQDQKDPSEKGGEQNKSDPEPEDQEEKQGDLSKEDAERILQMMQEQEREKLRAKKMMNAENNSKKAQQQTEGEDW